MRLLVFAQQINRFKAIHSTNEYASVSYRWDATLLYNLCTLIGRWLYGLYGVHLHDFGQYHNVRLLCGHRLQKNQIVRML